MPEWNEQQRKAIHTKHKNILVSASAGSGKTTVLIARLMDLVMHDHVSIDAICAMTFTEAAANEMKKRLASELQKAYQSANDQERGFISTQLTNIQTANISTIHSFCLSILQNYYYIIGIRAQRIAHVMDNGEITLYQGQAMEEAFEIQYKKQDEDFIHLTQMFSTRPENNEALQSMIVTLATLASSKSESDLWLSSLSAAYQNICRIEDVSMDLQENFFEYLFVESKRYEENIQKIDQLFLTKYSEDIKKHTIVKQKLAALTSIFSPLQLKDYAQFRQEFINVSHAVVPPCPDKEDKEYAKLRKDVLAIEDRMLSNLFTEDEFVKDIAKLHPFIEKLVEMCKDYRHAYTSLKEKNDGIDFDDMEHLALEILRANNGQIASIYREKFVEIMVDEFQDSNDVQNDLVNLICKKDNVFRVGDIKQSIYGFRHAKPQLMRTLIEDCGEYDDVIYLSNNYRSKKMIVDFNNELFKQLMNMDGFSCSYAKEDDVDTGVPQQNENNVPIRFHAIFHEEIKENENLIIAKNTLKANYIANQIISIKDKEQRAWKDFVVLVRGNARKDNLKAAFDELHIPYFIDIKYGFYQSSSVQIMLSALKCLCNPHNDIAFVALMMSPLFQRSAQDLASAKLGKEKNESYYTYFKAHPFPTFECFETLKETAHSIRLSEMLNALYNVENYYANHTSIQEKTNLDLLFDKAVQFEQDFASGIEAFLAQIEQIKDAQTAEAIPVGSEADVVRVMSIHQSKGLQFPIVFLWSTDNQTPIEFKDYCIADSDLGIAMKAMDLPQRYIRTTIQRIAMEHKKDKEELEEEMRILYVATTRAQQQMHIVDCIASLDTYQTPLTMSGIYNRNGYTSWILQTYLTHPSPLFAIHEVHHLWENQVQPREELPYQCLPLYQHPSTPLQFSTATKIKEMEVPEFSLDKVAGGSLYGTHMHNMVEQMKNQMLTYEDIERIAEEISFDIRPNDIQALRNLQDNAIYTAACKNECHYELPFTVQSESEILHGYMDFVSFDEKSITIVDFKTDALNSESDFIQRYQEQLHTYQKALETLYPDKSMKLYIYAFHLHNMIPIQ